MRAGPRLSSTSGMTTEFHDSNRHHASGNASVAARATLSMAIAATAAP